MQGTGGQHDLERQRASGRQRRHRLVVLVALTFGLVVGGGCTRASLRSDLDRSSLGDEDLVALLPKGLDAVLDVDVAGLRQLDSAAALLGYLPARSLAHLETVVDLPLRNLDALAVGLRSLGTSEYDVVVVARGQLARERVLRGVRTIGATREVEYHGVPLIESVGDYEATGQVAGGLAAALLTPRTVVLASRFAVRQVIDIFRGADDGARQQGDLMAALGRAPRAKLGRPAVLMATVMSPPVRERLRSSQVPELGADAEFITAALAVGDGLDLGVVAAYPELSIAQDVATRLLDRAQALRNRPALTFIGIERMIEPLVAVAVPPAPARGRRSPELHLAYRLSNADLSEFLSRISKLQKLRERLSGS